MRLARLQGWIASVLVLMCAPATLVAAERQLIATVSFATPGTTAASLTVRKLLLATGIHLEASDQSGRVVWTSSSLGTADRLFVSGERRSRLAALDLTGDGVPEIITAASSPPRSGLLHVFRFAASGNQFEPVACVFPKDGVTRESFISDLTQEDGQDLSVLADGRVRTLGHTYASEGTGKPGAGMYFFAYRDGAYHFVRVDEIPRGPAARR